MCIRDSDKGVTRIGPVWQAHKLADIRRGSIETTGFQAGFRHIIIVAVTRWHIDQRAVRPLAGFEDFEDGIRIGLQDTFAGLGMHRNNQRIVGAPERYHRFVDL